MKVSGAEVERRLGQFQARARKAGVKLTHQRLEILREVASREDHPDAEVVFRGVRGRLPTVSLDTVYRTLWMLHDLGLVATLGPRRESVRFDANLAQHHHFVCFGCGSVRDFVNADLAAIDVGEAVSGLGRVESTHVEARGLCSRCAGGKAAVRSPASAGQPARRASRKVPVAAKGRGEARKAKPRRPRRKDT